MPTARGWAALGVAGALLVLWIGFGEVELMTTAVFLLAAVVVGLVLVGVRGSAVSLTRRLSPAQAHEGDTVVVEVEVAAARRLRNVIVEDAVHGLGVARFAAATIAGPAVARYEVHCRFRGAYAVGPAEVSVMDPFGLSELRYRAGTTDRLLVYPRVERLSGLPEVRGLDPAVHAARPTFAPHGGEDFFTLREYQVGDDLRRVHWPSSAKRDSLVIKQLEVPWQARALVLLDVRAERYPIDEAFEHAVRRRRRDLASPRGRLLPRVVGRPRRERAPAREPLPPGHGHAGHGADHPQPRPSTHPGAAAAQGDRRWGAGLRHRWLR
jgi:uncharacterized protein (DUF58 family)